MSAPTDEFRPPPWAMLTSAGLTLDAGVNVWFPADADSHGVPPIHEVDRGEADHSPLVARHLASLRGPVVVLGAAPPTLIRTLARADRHIVVLISDAERAARHAQWHLGNETVAVVAGDLNDLGHGIGFGAAIALDLSDAEEYLIPRLRSLLATDGELVVTTASSRRTWIDRLTAAGFSELRLMSMFPDTAMPTLLISSGPSTIDDAPGHLIIAGSHPTPTDPVLVRFTGSHRRARFRVANRIEQTAAGPMVRRDRLHPHLPTTSGPLAQTLQDEPFLSGHTWSSVLDDIVSTPGWTVADIAVWFRRWADELTRAAGPHEQLAGQFLDAIPRNLIVDGDRGTFIDLEWTWTDVLLRQTVVFRALLHSLNDMTEPSTPDPSVPMVLGELICQVAEQAQEPLGARGIEDGWQFEKRLQSLVSGVPTVPDHLEDHYIGPTAQRPLSTTAQLDGLQITLAGIRAENDALRADVDALLTELDRAGGGDEQLRIAHEALQAERDAIAAHRDAVVADRELVREDLWREIESQRQTNHQQHQHIIALTSELHRASGTASAHRHARAQAAINDYRRDVRDRQVSDRETELLAQIAIQRERASAAEAARIIEARRASHADAALEATLSRLSWRLTRPLRAIRHHQLKAISWRPWRLASSNDFDANGSPAKQDLGSPKKRRRRSGKPAPGQSSAESGNLFVDLEYYRSRYPDLAHLSDARLSKHFASFGRREGRMAVSWLHSSLILPPADSDERERILIALADAGLGDSTQLALSLIQELSKRYHVVTVLAGGGELAEAITGASGTAVLLDHTRALAGEEARVLADDLRREFEPLFAVTTSLASHEIAIGLEQADIPVVALINEPDGSADPTRPLLQFLLTASELVYPAEFLAASMPDPFGAPRGRDHTIAFPGRVSPPPTLACTNSASKIRTAEDSPTLPEVSLEQFLTSLDSADAVIIGVGSVCRRKGVDLFVEAAERTRPHINDRRVRFVWVTDGHENDAMYLREIADQYQRLQPEVSVTFASQAQELQSLYQRADIMFLSSRLDYLPTAAIDASRLGVPVVCFDGASSHADWLLSLPSDESSKYVVPPLDTARVAQVLTDLLDRDDRPRVSDLLLKSADADFQMSQYVDTIEALGRRARSARDAQQEVLPTILVPGGFDVAHYTGGQGDHRREFFAKSYLRVVQAVAPLGQAHKGTLIQRPRPGFHPLIYAESAPGFTDNGDDPYAHFLRAGSPKGRWSKRLIVPRPEEHDRSLTDALLTVLVHGHFHYPDLLPAFLDRLDSFRHTHTLILTTTTNDAATRLRAICRARTTAVDAQVLVVPNRGRNLSALFSGPVAEQLLDYDVVLHVHSKRSPHINADDGDRWRDYLWQHLLGDGEGFGDQIVEEFAASTNLGLVAPEDRRLNDWDLNRLHAEQLVRRLGRTMSLPTHFDFPLGAMFWARTAALRPLVDAALDDDDYPPEPLPVDGTSLHALERLIPLIVEDEGFEFAKTYRPTLHR